MGEVQFVLVHQCVVIIYMISPRDSAYFATNLMNNLI
jgi:hypothetical protein